MQCTGNMKEHFIRSTNKVGGHPRDERDFGYVTPVT